MVARRILLFLAVAGLFIPVAWTQQVTDPNGDVFLGGPKYKKQKTPTSRTLRGTVSDPDGKPLGGALVTLTDVGKGVKYTFITKGNGKYHFDDLPFHIDYEVSAEYLGKKSESKKLSQYDNNPEAVRMLEVAPPKAAAATH